MALFGGMDTLHRKKSQKTPHTGTVHNTASPYLAVLHTEIQALQFVALLTIV